MHITVLHGISIPEFITRIIHLGRIIECRIRIIISNPHMPTPNEIAQLGVSRIKITSYAYQHIAVLKVIRQCKSKVTTYRR